MNLEEVVRMTTLAEAFYNLGHEVIMLGDGHYDYIFSNRGFRREHIPYDRKWWSDERCRIIYNADDYGLNFITEGELDRFVKEEVNLLNRIKPRAVITGFRPTMSVSTKVAKVLLVWVFSAVASDMYFEKSLATVPFGIYRKIPLLKLLPKSLRNRIVAYVAYNFPVRLKNWNKVMKRYGLKSFSSPIKVVRGDFNLMSDAPELFPKFNEDDLPPYYGFCGPLLMEETAFKMPESVKQFQRKKKRPLILVSMGSSGSPEVLKDIISGFMDRPYDLFVATSTIIEKKDIPYIPKNVIVEKYLPFAQVASMADVAVIHGGTGTVYTTAMCGVPFVGIPMFHEQQFNLENLARHGCGIVLPRPKLRCESVIKAVDKILNDPKFKEKSIEIQSKIIKYKKDKEFYPPKKGAEKILKFLEHPEYSYFNLKGI
jgi:UDP:flavonoid glycosyltransferase YjiC (YdhE family)